MTSCIASELDKGSIYFGVALFSYSELADATANFDRSNELGNGGFGVVYYGKLKDGREVAVKCLYEKSCKRVEQFMNEVELLTLLRHQNLVSFYSCTSQHCKELLLVYEFVKNGTLANHLHTEKAKSKPSLPWPVCLRIAIETATALSYLHASDIVHRDGTPGYLDPEYHQCYHLTDKSDVYSFGVVLTQLISSLPAIDLDRHKNEINLSNYAINRIQRSEFDALVDPQLGSSYDFKVKRMTKLVAELAYQCLQHDREIRQPMEVVDGLKRIESADYEAFLQAENMANNVEDKVVDIHTSNAPSLHVHQDD
ncbi:LEAF RUST 10 DISEASE-RESISTANCE LOCUS RECEPTOR-LIKE PROTEIN KINASE-like 1.1, partial [Bienertia sinuspersici]